MDLLKVELKRFRRYESASIDLLGRLVAIVGPNEAGKSSLLEALTRLNDNDRLPDGDLTRGTLPNDDEVVITARFALDKDDKASIAGIGEAAGARQLIVSKTRGGARRGLLDPATRRNRAANKAAKTLLAKVRQSRWAKESEAPISDETWDGAASALDLKNSTIQEDQLVPISSLADLLPEEPQRSHPAQLRSQLQAVLIAEREPHPQTQAVRILLGRLPEFILFGEQDRTLGSTYDLTTAVDSPPPALLNFASLAKLDLAVARDVAARSDFGELETIQRSANAVLESVFSSGWRQSVMRVQVRFDRAELRPIVQNLSGRFTELGERSDGLRIFVALVAYLAKKERPFAPVLLIDEAETHLHYDAQADLVRVLHSQDAATKVVYTTHSAGALPFDLGSGIRVVRMREGDRSDIDNSFWKSAPGFTPLVMAMGAAALAFTPTRRAVIGEGITESILLPALLREAVDQSELDYQVAPGLANAGKGVIDTFDLEAARVAFLVDSDQGGKERKQYLLKVGVPADRIVMLGAPNRSNLVIEDLVRPELYRQAVNAEIAQWQSTATQMPASAVPNRGRVAAVASWCKKNKVNVPDKKRVAAQVLSLRGDGRLTNATSRVILADLHRKLREILDRPRLGLAPSGTEET